MSRDLNRADMARCRAERYRKDVGVPSLPAPNDELPVGESRKIVLHNTIVAWMPK